LNGLFLFYYISQEVSIDISFVLMIFILYPEHEKKGDHSARGRDGRNSYRLARSQSIFFWNHHP